MEKVVITVVNSRWFGGRPYMEPVAALPILAAVLKDNFEYEIIDGNGNDLSESESFNQIKATEAKIVLIPALSVDLFRHYSKIASIAREALPNAIIVIGGVYATTCYEYAVEDKNIDYVFLGHAEERLCPVLNRILDGSIDTPPPWNLL